MPPLLDRFQAIAADLESFVAGHHYDIAIVEHFWCAPHAAVLRPHSDRLILDLHNIESEWHARCGDAEGFAQRWIHRRFARLYQDLECQWLPVFDDVIVTSDIDASRLSGRSRIHLYPNSLPNRPELTRPRENVIAFSGNFEYLPNIQAVRFFREDIWPILRSQLPDLRWRLIGRNPQAAAQWTAGDPNIEVTGPIEDAVEEISRAQIAVVPLLSGSGTRLKILEAWAAATPVVSTHIGAEGLQFVDGRHLVLADDPRDFAQATLRLLNDESRRTQIGIAGRQQFETTYTWEAAWQTLNWLTNPP